MGLLEKFELEILCELKASGAIKPGEHLLGATVFPSGIPCPTAAGLLNKSRQWTVKVIYSV